MSGSVQSDRLACCEYSSPSNPFAKSCLWLTKIRLRKVREDLPLLKPLATLRPGFESGLRSLPVNPEAFWMVSTVCHPQGSPSVHLGLLSREEEWHSQCHSHPSEGNPHSLKSHSLSKHTSPRRQPSESHNTPGDRRRHESPLLGTELIVLEQTLFSVSTSCLVPLPLPSPGLPGAQHSDKRLLCMVQGVISLVRPWSCLRFAEGKNR